MLKSGLVDVLIHYITIVGFCDRQSDQGGFVNRWKPSISGRICVIILGIAGLIGMLCPGRAPAITASDFQLTGSDGRVAARLTMSGEGTPALFFFDKQGRNRMNLSLYPEGVGGLVMNDTEGRAVAIVRMHGTHERPVLVFKSGGQDRLIVGLRDDESGEPYLQPVPRGIIESASPELVQYLWPVLQVVVAALAGFVAGKVASRT
jgi:hypothetical protein